MGGHEEQYRTLISGRQSASCKGYVTGLFTFVHSGDFYASLGFLIARRGNVTPTRSLLAGVVLLLLSACSSATISQLDRDTYMATGQSRLSGNTGAAADAVLRADVYCKERGKRMQLTGTEGSDGVFVVWPSKSVVMFKCVT